MEILYYPSIAKVNESKDLRDYDFVPNNSRAFSVCKHMERLLKHSEFVTRKERLSIVDKKEHNIPLTTTEASIDDGVYEDNDVDIKPTEDTTATLSLRNPDLKPSGFVHSEVSTQESPTSTSPLGTPSGRLSPTSNNKEIIANFNQQSSPLIGTRKAISSSPTANENNIIEVEQTDECKCSRMLKKLVKTFESRLLFSRHLALIIEAFAIGQTSRSHYGSYRVELIISLFNRIVDLQNFHLVLVVLNPREYAQIIIRMGYLTFFNPFSPQGFYYIDHNQWDHRQLLKILMLINHYEPNTSSMNDLVFKQINNHDVLHDAIANNPNNDHDNEHPEQDQSPTEQNTLVHNLSAWYDEHSFPKEGVLTLNFLCADSTSDQIEMNTKRFSLLPLLLLDHDEVTRVIDISLPVLHEADFHRHHLHQCVKEIRQARKIASEKSIDNDISEKEQIIDNVGHNEVDDDNIEIDAKNTDNENMSNLIEETDIEVDNKEVTDNKDNTEDATTEVVETQEVKESNDNDDPPVVTYPKTTIDQLNNYVHDKTEFKWNFTKFIENNSNDADADDGFDL